MNEIFENDLPYLTFLASGEQDRTVFLLWSDFKKIGMSEDISSVCEVIEKNSEIIKNEYLKFINSLGISEIEGQSVRSYLALRKSFSFWWMTFVAEKNTHSADSNYVYESAKILALQIWLKDKKFDHVELYGISKASSESIKNLVSSLGITTAIKPTFWAKNLKGKLLYLLRKPIGLTTSLAFLVYYAFTRREFIKLYSDGLKSIEPGTVFIDYSDNLEEGEFSSDDFSSKYWGDLPKVLQEGSNRIFLHVFVPDKLLPSSEAAVSFYSKLNEKSNHEQHVCLDSFLSFRLIFSCLVDWFRTLRKSKKLAGHLRVVSDVLWPIHHRQFEKSFYNHICMRNLLMHCLFEEVFTVLPRQTRGIYLQENQSWEPGLISSWYAAGHGELIGSIHWCLSYWYLRMFTYSVSASGEHNLPTPDLTVANSSVSLRMLQAENFSGKVTIGEALRFQYLARPLDQISQINAAKHEKKSLLFIGEYSEELTKSMLNFLLLSKGDLSDKIDLIIKFHPNNYLDVKNLAAYDYKITTKPIQELSIDADIAFCGNTSSGVMDAFLAGLPIVSMNAIDNFNLSPLIGTKNVRFVSNHDEFCQAVTFLIDDEMDVKPPGREYFCLDIALSKWREILG